jgi:hypothetical protein
VGRDQIDDGRMVGLLARWEAARAGRPWPRRRDLLPESMPTLLGYVCLYDVEPEPVRFRFRVMGTHVATSYRRDMTGRYVDEIEPAEYAAMLAYDLAEAVAGARPTVRRVTFSSARGRRSYTRLALPLSREGDRLDALLTASAFAREGLGPMESLANVPEL